LRKLQYFYKEPKYPLVLVLRKLISTGLVFIIEIHKNKAMRKIWIFVQILLVFLLGTQKSFSQQFYVTTGDSVFVVDAGSCKAKWLCTMSGPTTEDLASYKNTLGNIPFNSGFERTGDH